MGLTAAVPALASLLATLAVAAPAATPVERATEYLVAHRAVDGGFAEPNGRATVGLTAWATIGLAAARADTGRAAEFIAERAGQLGSATDVELAVVAVAATNGGSHELEQRLRQLPRASGAIGPTVNSTIWGILAFRALGLPAPPGSVRHLLRHQHRSGGWGWSIGGPPDSNDTAGAIQALRAAGLAKRSPPLRRAVAFLRRHRNRDGGFELVEGRGSDVQSTAWAIQALIAAGEPVPAASFAYLRRMQRPDGSFRYSARYVATPVWVTAQALAALARRPLPIR